MLFICSYFLLFFIYCVIGYIVEVSFIAICQKKLNFSRGFLIGPYIPIYGTGIMLMTTLLTKYQDDYIVLFILGATLCTILEYITSYIMEKIYKLRWWDYSNKKFNINGRVCLENSVLFGLGGLVVIKLINPLFERFINYMSPTLVIILAMVTFLIFITDVIISIFITFNLGININEYIKVDATSKIKKEIEKRFKSYTFLHKRILKAYPNIAFLDRKKLKFIREMISQSKKELKKIKDK